MLDRPERKAGRDQIKAAKLNFYSWLNFFGLPVGALLAYILYLTGDFFLGWSPLKSNLVLPLLLILLAVGIGTRLASRLPFHRLPRVLAREFPARWPWAALLLALALGGWLRWQTLNNPPSLTGAELQYSRAALTVLRRSDWHPPDFNRPPLYLYTYTLLLEGLAIQNSTKPGAPSIDEIKPETFLVQMRWFNLALGLLCLFLVYGCGALLLNRRAGALAALLLAGAWISYRATPLLAVQHLGAFLAVLAFYLIIRQWKRNPQGVKTWAFAGGAWGVALAATYGSLGLLLPLTLALKGGRESRKKKLLVAVGAGFLVFSLLVVGWVLDLPRFLNGLASIGKAPDQAFFFYLKTLATHDPGLLLGLSACLVLTPFLAEKAWGLALSFPLYYLLTLAFIGPVDEARLVLFAPFLALVAVFPLQSLAEFLNRGPFGARFPWLGSGVVLMLVLGFNLLGSVIRRLN